MHALLLWGANPVYDHPDGAAFRAALQKVALSISFADRRDETSAHVHAVCPDHHFLEAWGDAEPVSGHFSLRQPLIAPLHDTRAADESLRDVGGPPDRPAHSPARVLASASSTRARARRQAAFEGFWERALERGVIDLPRPPVATRAFAGGLEDAVRAIVSRANRAGRWTTDAGYELALHETVGARDGRHANNPWLQELPDPMTRLTWGNVASVAPATAAALGVATGDVVALTSETGRLELPVFVQPGQQRRTISVAVGYGRWAAGKAGDGVGGNVFPLARVENGARRYSARGRRSRRRAGAPGWRPRRRTSRWRAARSSQTIDHEPRRARNAAPAQEPEREKLPDLWRERLHGAHAWGMAIDLDACTGCSACVVACQSENNVPVVGARRGAREPRDALDAHRPLLRRRRRGRARGCTSR